jgi:membrane-associated phospholipid phosphatase
MKRILVILTLAVFQLLGQEQPQQSATALKLAVNEQSSIAGKQISVRNHFRVLKVLAAATVGAVLIGQVDKKIDEEYALEQHKFPFSMLHQYGDFGKWYDHQQTYYALGSFALGALGYSWYRSDPYLSSTVFKVAEAYLFTAAASYILKISLGRDRPYLNSGSTSFHPFRFDFNASKMSFPSGHTATVFAMMTVLARRSTSRWLKGAFYAMALSVGFQRMLYRKHWASDVIFGGALGYCIGELVSAPKSSKLQSIQFQLMPVGVKKVGLAIVF